MSNPQLKSATLTIKLTATAFTMCSAADMFSEELRRIANLLDEGETLGESGNMWACSHGSWSLSDPWDPEAQPIPSYGSLADYRIDLAAAQAAYDANPSSKNASDLHAAKEALERRQK